MKILWAMGVQEHNISGITQMFWEDIPKMDKMVDFIKDNTEATETEILRKAVEIAKEQE